MGVLAPPLLTVLIFLWAGSTINDYLLRPLETSAREALIWATADIRSTLPGVPAGALRTSYAGRIYQRTPDEEYIPAAVYDRVKHGPMDVPLADTALGIYRQYIDQTYLRSIYVVPFFLAAFTLALYLLGKFMAAGIGRFFVNLFEWGINLVPVVRGVYSGAKQVSDFMFSERDIEFTRVVALEYPRKGLWSIGFVTGEGFLDIRSAANEPVVSVFLPCSPLPLSGFTINCPRSELVDLKMTFDQACQYMISCGVVTPSQQVPHFQGLAADEHQPPGETGPGPADAASAPDATATDATRRPTPHRRRARCRPGRRSAVRSPAGCCRRTCR